MKKIYLLLFIIFLFIISGCSINSKKSIQQNNNLNEGKKYNSPWPGGVRMDEETYKKYIKKVEVEENN